MWPSTQASQMLKLFGRQLHKTPQTSSRSIQILSLSVIDHLAEPDQRDTHLGFLELESQPLVMPDDLLPWFGQRRCRHRWKGQFARHGGQQCALKWRLGLQTSGEGQRSQGRPSPLSRPLQQFGVSSRQEAASIDIRRSHVHVGRSVCAPSPRPHVLNRRGPCQKC